MYEKKHTIRKGRVGLIKQQQAKLVSACFIQNVSGGFACKQ